MIEIYLIPIPKENEVPELVSKYFALLRSDSAEGHHFNLQDKRKLPSLLSYAALHYIIHKKTGIERALRLMHTSKGKPFLPDFPQIHFSISHSGCYACIAVSDNKIGVDIERERVCKFEIVERFFHPQEAEDIARINEGAIRDSYFTRLWTLKESYVKLLGVGIANIFNHFAISVQNEETIFSDDDNGKNTETPFFKSYYYSEKYWLSVCAFENVFPEKPILLLPETIVH